MNETLFFNLLCVLIILVVFAIVRLELGFHRRDKKDKKKRAEVEVEMLKLRAGFTALSTATYHAFARVDKRFKKLGATKTTAKQDDLDALASYFNKGMAKEEEEPNANTNTKKEGKE